MRHFRPLKTIRLDPVTAQEEASKQRLRFMRLIVEMFPLDFEAERMGWYGKPRLDASEYRYAVALLQLRPALALAILFLRGFCVIWARTRGEASRSSLNAEQAPSFSFFLNSWNQNSLVTVLYPSIALLHLRPRIELGGNRLAAFAERTPASGSAEWSCSLR